MKNDVQQENGTPIGLARILAFQGDHAAAGALYQESFALLHTIGNKEFIAACLEGLGAIGAVQGQPAWAAQLWGAAEAVRQRIGAPLPHVPISVKSPLPPRGPRAAR